MARCGSNSRMVPQNGGDLDPVIVEAVRTPVGRYRGALSRVRPDDLAAVVLDASLSRAPAAKKALGEVVFGATNQAGEDNRNVARMAALLAGLPYEVPAVTVNRLCGSGLEAIIAAARAIRLGDYEVMVAGGVESMSRAPYVMNKAEEALPRTPPGIFDSSLGWRFPNPRMRERFELHSMGETAENVAERYDVSREDQDAFALTSHQRADAAWKDGAFDREVVSVPIPKRKKEPEAAFDRDEGVRPDTSLEKLAALRPVFREGGTVTAGNSSPLSDGAAAVVVTSRVWATAQGLAPLATVRAWAATGVHPNYMGIGPVTATRSALKRANLGVNDIEIVELNEAFAAQSLACIRELGLDPKKVNLRGGAIALGHPIGSSGARIVVTLAHLMRDRQARYGLATLCIGVGQGLAMILEREPGPPEHSS